jgi:hypothetical protein
MGALHLSGILLHSLLHAQGGVAGAHRVVLMRQRRPKQRHNAVAHDLIDGAFILVHGRHHAVEHRIEQLPRLLWVTFGQQLHGPLEVGEEHRDLLAFAFQGAFGVQDFLGEMGRRVGARRLGRRERGLGAWGGWWPGERPPTAAAELLPRLIGKATGRTGEGQGRPTLGAETATFPVVLLALRALHQLAPLAALAHPWSLWRAALDHECRPPDRHGPAWGGRRPSVR